MGPGLLSIPAIIRSITNTSSRKAKFCVTGFGFDFGKNFLMRRRIDFGNEKTRYKVWDISRPKETEPGRRRCPKPIWKRKTKGNKIVAMQLSPKMIKKLWIRDKTKSKWPRKSLRYPRSFVQMRNCWCLIWETWWFFWMLNRPMLPRHWSILTPDILDVKQDIIKWTRT